MKRHEPIDDEIDCLNCNDSGYVCDNCGEADGNYTCEDGPELVRCADCDE